MPLFASTKIEGPRHSWQVQLYDRAESADSSGHLLKLLAPPVRKVGTPGAGPLAPLMAHRVDLEVKDDGARLADLMKGRPDRDFVLRVLRDGAPDFEGLATLEAGKRALRRQITRRLGLTAYDGLESLKERPFDGTGTRSVLRWIYEALLQTSLTWLGLHAYSDWQQAGGATGLGAIYVPAGYFEEDTSWHDVLTELLELFGLVLQQHAGAWVAVQRSLRASSSLPAPEVIGAQDPGGLGEQVVDPAALARSGGPAQRPQVQRLAPLKSAELEWSFEQTVLENKSFDEDGFPLKGWTYVGVEVEDTSDGTAVVHDAATDYVEQRFNAPLRREGDEDPSVEMRLRFSTSGDSARPRVGVAEFRFDDAVTGDAYWLTGPPTNTEWKASEAYLEESARSDTPIQNPFWKIQPMPGSGRGTLTVRTRFDDGGGAYDALDVFRVAVAFHPHSDKEVDGVAQHERGRWTLGGSGRREQKLQTRLGTSAPENPRAGVLLAAPGGDAVAGIGAQERALGEAWVREVGKQLEAALRQVDLWSPPGGDPIDAVRTADLQGEQRRYAPVHLKERIGRDVQRLVAAEVRTDGDVSGVAAPEWKETNPLSPEVLNEPPVAVFDLEQDGKTVSVDASDSYDEDGTVESYDWQFGDGVGASGPTASHTYSTGSYRLVLTVRDDQDATGTLWRTVEVDGAAPQADFTFTDTSGNTATVDASPSTVDPDNEIVRYDWEWGDGSPPTKDGDVEESHDYPPDDEYYYAKLTITDSRGNTDSQGKYSPR